MLNVIRFILFGVCSVFLYAQGAHAYTIMVVGDSISRGYKATPYPVYLQSMLEGQATVVNVAVGGQFSSIALRRLRTNLERHQPQFVLIMIGTNDAKAGLSPYLVAFNISKMIEIVREADAVPVISTIPPNTRDRAITPLISRNFNPELINLASNSNTRLVDSYGILNPNWRAWTIDGIHPNNAGSRALAEGFYAALPNGGGGGNGGNTDSGGGRCFIATAAFGSQLEPHVVLLQQFRDEVLLAHPIGQRFVDWYYDNSPPVARFIAEHERLRPLARGMLYPLIGFSYCILHWAAIAGLALAMTVAALLLAPMLSKRRRILSP
ncbi:SGNH/GDSL hydrolase family protein [Desulfobulbus alkaliphilus]|uniref:SGNH/GDSL hydrolase family protein n=1 Tax=Desulfobulbus alkaliphilus TaxID=869814 RepID=UPI0019644019|nr:CFI-box-CTERM domain-containing protein [Desulfobulbus alkaliphilus]MBM9538004.1 hypothetical protein [Desulfobulbus alkaliphilus]